jgi:hypothetical protein
VASSALHCAHAPVSEHTAPGAPSAVAQVVSGSPSEHRTQSPPTQNGASAGHAPRYVPSGSSQAGGGPLVLRPSMLSVAVVSRSVVVPSPLLLELMSSVVLVPLVVEEPASTLGPSSAQATQHTKLTHARPCLIARSIAALRSAANPLGG